MNLVSGSLFWELRYTIWSFFVNLDSTEWSCWRSWMNWHRFFWKLPQGLFYKIPGNRSIWILNVEWIDDCIAHCRLKFGSVTCFVNFITSIVVVAGQEPNFIEKVKPWVLFWLGSNSLYYYSFETFPCLTKMQIYRQGKEQWNVFISFFSVTQTEIVRRS